MTPSKEEIKTAIEVAICAIAAQYGENGLFVRRGTKQNVMMEFTDIVATLTELLPEEDGKQDNIATYSSLQRIVDFENIRRKEALINGTTTQDQGNL